MSWIYKSLSLHRRHFNWVCLRNNHVFYAVSTYEFFYTIELRSNNLHPSSTSRQSQITRSQIHISQEIIFFYARTRGQIASRSNRSEEPGGLRRDWRIRFRDESVPVVRPADLQCPERTCASETVEKRGREGERKSMCFFTEMLYNTHVF